MMSGYSRQAIKILLGLLAGVLFCCGSGLWGLWPKVKLDGTMLSWADVPSSGGTLAQLPLENSWIQYVIGDRNDTFYFSGQANELDIMNLIDSLPRKTVSIRHRVSIEEWRANTNFPGLPRDSVYKPGHDDVYRLEGRLNPYLWLELTYWPRTRWYASTIYTIGDLKALDAPAEYLQWRSEKLKAWNDAGRR